MKRTTIVITMLALMVPAVAWPEDGWASYTDEPTTDTIGAPPGFENPPQRPLETDDAPGVGPAGPQGPQGPAGPQGPKGDSADLCQNIPGVQTTPGFKYWAQRYWSFNPKREKRYLATNRKGQIVCVTLRWIRKHTPQ